MSHRCLSQCSDTLPQPGFHSTLWDRLTSALFVPPSKHLDGPTSWRNDRGDNFLKRQCIPESTFHPVEVGTVSLHLDTGGAKHQPEQEAKTECKQKLKWKNQIKNLNLKMGMAWDPYESHIFAVLSVELFEKFIFLPPLWSFWNTQMRLIFARGTHRDAFCTVICFLQWTHRDLLN